ncbi:hypothetical protein ETAA8_66010 [Anatilimnocola aggregata]|uniref:Uncharacterized protein n=1 Tax=Anatilimnocola aggregata TaxID=2528021 RepID=A0A517YMJ7_9BACT|nr:hypothetical protein [Anatilimnocola aggregata]QDU31443.1 hypothetical protein ETAA8_66010 [Anatilimnocola aggregata]
MARCEQGYLCDVCGEDVGDIWQSELYLRYVIGQLDPETLHTTPERHIRCTPVLAQFIVHEAFAPIVVEGDFDKRLLDPNFVRQREDLVTRGWLRLCELGQQLDGLSLLEYPLPEIQQQLERTALAEIQRAGGHLPRNDENA